MTRPLVLGLTGSIGMGKSTVAAMFDRLGVPVFDADREVRRMQGPNGALVPAIEAAFPGCTGPEGVDRPALAAQVFGDPTALDRLEAVVHPAVRAAREAFLLGHAGAPLVLFDIPLLFEKRGIDEVDKVLVVSAAPAIQRARVLAREGMTPERFADILAIQLADEQKRARADFVIDTGQSLTVTEGEVRALVEKLGGQ